MKKTTLFIVIFLAHLFSQDYYPLAVGNSWTYLSTLDDSILYDDTTFIRIIGDTTHEQWNFYVVQRQNVSSIKDTTVTYYIVELENDIYTVRNLDDIGNSSEKICQHTLSDGDTWQYGNSLDDSSKVSFVYTVELSGNKYSNCYAIRTELFWGDTSTNYYAPNIGLIKRHSQFMDLDPSGMILVDFNIEDETTLYNQRTVSSSSLYSIEKNYLSLKLNVPANLSIFNVSGRKLYNQVIDKTIDLTDINISNGLYLIKVEAKEIIQWRHYLLKK